MRATAHVVYQFSNLNNPYEISVVVGQPFSPGLLQPCITFALLVHIRCNTEIVLDVFICFVFQSLQLLNGNILSVQVYVATIILQLPPQGFPTKYFISYSALQMLS
ncbi:hypothetical protein J6590_052778 [Homalodisca vitripennis]|nr:hypothetical protein J6590_052778 [Homalodisca vitripennis]